MDQTEFKKLYAKCKSALERFIYYKMPMKIDGDDVLQETALAAFNNMHTISNTQSFKAWIVRIASNKCNDFYRNKTRIFEKTVDMLPEAALAMNIPIGTVKSRLHTARGNFKTLIRFRSI